MRSRATLLAAVQSLTMDSPPGNSRPAAALPIRRQGVCRRADMALRRACVLAMPADYTYLATDCRIDSIL